MRSSDDIFWWYILMICFHDIFWRYLLTIYFDKIFWRYILMISSHYILSWYLLTISSHDIFWRHLLIRSSDDILWWYLLMRSSHEIISWSFVLLLLDLRQCLWYGSHLDLPYVPSTWWQGRREDERKNIMFLMFLSLVRARFDGIRSIA